MKQISKVFHKSCMGNHSVDDQLNTYLEEHPTYQVDKVSYSKEPGRESEHLFVVFNVPNQPIGI